MPLSPRRQLLVLLLSLLAVAACADAIFWYSTKFGVGLANDSQDYISTAQSIRAGRGVMVYNPNPEQGQQWVPLTVFPPMYPALLALSGEASGKEIIPAARYLHLFLLAANVLLAGLFAFAMTRSLLVAIAVAALPAALLLEIHTSGLSEATFIFFTLAGLWSISAFPSVQHRAGKWALLFAGAICVSAAMLTRYAGASVLASTALALLLLDRSPIRKRMVYTGIFVAIAILPLMVWTMHIGSASRATGRQIAFHPPDMTKLRQGMQIFLGWFAPLDWYFGRTRTGSIVFLISGLLLVWTLRGRKHLSRVWTEPAILVAVIFAVLYLPFLLVSMTFFDALIALNSRILSPLLIPLLAIMAAGIYRGSQARSARIAVVVGVSLFVALHLPGAISWGIKAHKNGLEYNSRAWRNSEILKQATELPPGAPIYTNGWDVLYLNGNRLSYSLPGVFRRKANQSVSDDKIEAQMSDMRQRMSTGGYLVFFDNLRSRSSFLADPEKVSQYFPLELVFSASDKANSPNSGQIYRLAASATSMPATVP